MSKPTKVVGSISAVGHQDLSKYVAMSNGSKTPPTDGTNSSPDRHAISIILGHHGCDTSTGLYAGMIEALANHAASARAEERRECAKLADDCARERAALRAAGNTDRSFGSNERYAIQHGAHEEAVRIRDAISRRRPQ